MKKKAGRGVQAGASYPLILRLPGFAHFLQPHAPRGLPVLPGGVGGQLLRLLGLRELLVFAEIQPRWRLIARFGLPLPQATCNEKENGLCIWRRVEFCVQSVRETKKIAKAAELAGG